ncbi:hypothetical protein [Streptomyces umbrinus]|uniref:hypothetical protein n=1 Tax=Streptomyces umbrinus TaxID=67370 RepID=UPI0033FFEE49
MAVSQNSNTKLREVAEAVVATTTRQEPLPRKFQEQLAAGRRAAGMNARRLFHSL